jgi:hypothetical protein
MSKEALAWCKSQGHRRVQCLHLAAIHDQADGALKHRHYRLLECRPYRAAVVNMLAVSQASDKTSQHVRIIIDRWGLCDIV